ncbi:four helix bundle protein [Parapedobacter sp. DT-150]|uniref:four helix bundle protein n=1 Tax=Parapedobacter sp. DT-150 TaxID=3396162 RepID=UPI003F1B0E94
MGLHNLKEIKVWQKAVDLATLVYTAVSEFPAEERYGLTSQMKRAVVSIASNIGEGAGRNSDKEFVHFLGIAKGSSFELMTQLFISNQLGLISNEILVDLIDKIDELQRMIHGFQSKLNRY